MAKTVVVLLWLMINFLCVILINLIFFNNINLTCPESNITTICPNLTVNLSCPTCIYKCPNCPNVTCAPCFYEEKIYTSQFQEIISSIVVERKYDYNNWNCVDMSEELKKRLNNAGYSCVQKCGNYVVNNTKEGHCWVECNVIIEATSGNIITGDNYNKYVR